MKFDARGPCGYADAMEFLKSTGRLHLLDKEQSTDGYTLVALANSLYEKDQLNQTTSAPDEVPQYGLS
jgi:hypothetical protein